MLYTETGQKSQLVDQLKTDVTEWVENWVSRYNPKLDAVPCPYAKQAIMRETVMWRTATSRQDLKSQIKQFANNGFKNPDYEVMVLGATPDSINVYDLATTIRKLNKYVLMPAGWVALEDHPRDIEVVNNVVMNQGSWVLVLIQSLEKLNAASEHLAETGYYDKWSKENLEDVRDWRKAV